MPQQKRQTAKAKPETAPDAASDLIPAEIRELLGPSPVVDIAEEPIFEGLLASAVSELRPSGMIEWTLVFDFVVTTWEIRQLREYKTSVLRIANVEQTSFKAPEQTREKSNLTNRELAALFRTDDLVDMSTSYALDIYRKRIITFFEEIKPDPHGFNTKKLENLSSNENIYTRARRLATVIDKQAHNLDHLQRMTLMLEKRRDALLRDLDRRQVARREQNAVHTRHDRDATDIEPLAQG